MLTEVTVSDLFYNENFLALIFSVEKYDETAHASMVRDGHNYVKNLSEASTPGWTEEVISYLMVNRKKGNFYVDCKLRSEFEYRFSTSAMIKKLTPYKTQKRAS